MKNTGNAISNKLIYKIIATLFLIIVAVGMSYTVTTYFLTAKLYEEASQKINAQLAQHLIDEKFKNGKPFLDNGEINKALFGDIMHEMMAVNRSIEVYLIDEDGEVQYSVVLDHEKANAPIREVSLAPINDFLNCGGQNLVLGDDPREPDKPKIFSAAPYDIDGRKGFVYIILAGQAYANIQESLLTSFYGKIGILASIITVILAAIIGFVSVLQITKNLRVIIFAVSRFKEGDLTSRIPNPESMDLSVLATTYNSMADKIVGDIDKLKSVETLRRELIANVSHDLRTPLSIIQGYVETLRMKQDNLSLEKTDEYLQIIQNSSEKLSHLVTQLFEFSKLEAKQIEPIKERFQVNELAFDIYSNYQVLAKKKNISLRLEQQESLPLVFADISLVERVIQNLLDNALKYTPESGEVIIQIQSDHENVLLSVKDNGPGISLKDQEFIFERFKRANDENRKISAGLGLAIVKKIVEIHNSTIKVISAPNEGATFQFNLQIG